MPLKHEKKYDECFIYLKKLAVHSETKELVKNFYHDLVKKSNLDRNYNKVFYSLKESKSELNEIQEFKSILEFIPEELNNPFPKNWFKNNLFTTLKSSYLNKVKPKLVILSLSGGVDSMVSAILLIRLFKDQNSNIIIKAVHINYHNRDTSDLEQKFVSWFCKLIDLELYVGHIKNVKRIECDCVFYENSYKYVIFDTYRVILFIFKNTQIYDSEVFIVLGHNRDDIEENILNNICKMRDIFNLHGMEEKTYYSEFNTNIWRPLLSIQKKEIFKFAHENNVPYLINTTPEWSSRGRMRNTFLPALKEQFGESMLDSLLYLADTLKNYSPIIIEGISNIICNKINNNCLEIDYIELPIDGWIRVITKICNQLNVSIPRKKSIKYYYSIISRNNYEKVVNIKLTKDLSVKKESNKLVFSSNKL